MNAAVYLDYNATAKVRPEAAAAMAEALAAGGNPSSIHASGRAARSRVEAARRAVADLAGASPAGVVFTSGGTEADALAISSAVADRVERLIVGATEHEAVRRNAEASGLPVEIWPVDANGVADLEWLERRLADGGRTLVCLMLANNETGVIQPVAESAAMARAAGARLHVDAVQAAGKIAIDLEALGAHSLALSAHKLGGPQGVGALVIAQGASLTPTLLGGGQERGLRAGTENSPGIAGFGAASEAARRDLDVLAAQSVWRDGLARLVAEAGAVVLGEDAPRLPQTLSFATPGFASETQVMALDLAGVMVSAGAACTSGKVTPSAVATAMGRAHLAPFAIRVSGGWGSTAADWERCGEVWSQAWERHAMRVREVA